MDRFWLKNYPKGVPAEINVSDYASLREVFAESVGRFADRPAYSCMGKTITFRDLDHLSAAFGAYLQMNGCTKGTRVALMMPNILQYPVCLFGVLRSGCTVVNVNPLYTARELEHQLVDSGAEVIVVVENFARTVAEVLGKAGYKTGLFGKWHLGDSYPHRPVDQGFQESVYHLGWGMLQSAQDFDNPLISSHFQISSGGTGGRPTRILIDLDYLAERAPHWALWLEDQDLLRGPLVFITPYYPGIVNRQLICAKVGKPYARWYLTGRAGSASLRCRHSRS